MFRETANQKVPAPPRTRPTSGCSRSRLGSSKISLRGANESNLLGFFLFRFLQNLVIHLSINFQCGPQIVERINFWRSRLPRRSKCCSQVNFALPGHSRRRSSAIIIWLPKKPFEGQLCIPRTGPGILYWPQQAGLARPGLDWPWQLGLTLAGWTAPGRLDWQSLGWTGPGTLDRPWHHEAVLAFANSKILQFHLTKQI